MADGQAKDVDDLVHVGPDEVRAEDMARAFLDQRLVSVDPLGHAPRRVPIGRLLALDAELQSLLTSPLFGQADAGDGRLREGDARHAAIVGQVLVAFQQVGRRR